MIKYYLVPAEIIIEGGAKTRVPKYVDVLKLNWVGTYITSLDKYVIQTNSQFQAKHDSIKNNSDVVELDGTRATKDKLEKDLKIKKIKDEEDEFEVIGQMGESAFKKGKLFVVGD